MSVQDGLFQFYDAPFFGLQSPESMDDLADALRQNKVPPDRVDAFIADLLILHSMRLAAGRKTPPKGQKADLSRRSFSGDGSKPTRHGVESRAQALTRSRKPLLLSSNAF